MCVSIYTCKCSCVSMTSGFCKLHSVMCMMNRSLNASVQILITYEIHNKPLTALPNYNVHVHVHVYAGQ